MTLSERLRSAGASYGALQAARKPWDSRDKAPWGDGDEDGEEPNRTYPDGPGDEVSKPPSGDSRQNDLDMRSALTSAAERATDPEAARALLAIEARLGEIIQFMPAAKRGPQDVLFRLDVLNHFLTPAAAGRPS